MADVNVVHPGIFKAYDVRGLYPSEVNETAAHDIGGAFVTYLGAKRIAVITDHVTKDGRPKLVRRCTLPLTGVGCVTRVYTSLAVFDIGDGRFVLREKLPSLSLEALQAVTGAEIDMTGPVADLVVPEL